MRRVCNILSQQKIASVRTLEAKISESGLGIKPAPHVISNALRNLTHLDETSADEPLVVKMRRNDWPCDMYHLSSTDAVTLRDALTRKIPLEKQWHKRSTGDALGKQGELIVRQAFEADAKFFVAPAWGNVMRVNGKDIPARTGPVGSVDGLVILAHLPPQNGSAIVEVKNQREWIYPRDPALWDIIRNGFAVNAVPILFARKIYTSSFTYVLYRLGGIGIQMHAQFLPESEMERLKMCKNRIGLGFKDLDFNETVPKNLQNSISVIASQITSSRRQMNRVKETVLPYLDTLADDTSRTSRLLAYKTVQTLLDQRFGRVNT